MRKFSIFLLTTLFAISLTGCQLAVNENTDITTSGSNTETLNIGVPIEFKFEVYDENYEEGFKDISDYIYFSWLGSENLSFEVLTIKQDYGSSMVPITQSIGTDYYEDDYGNGIRENIIYFEADVYFSNQNSNLAIFPKITFMKEDGSTFEKDGTGFNLSDNISISKKYETVFSNGEAFTIEYKFNNIGIDSLKTIEIREYDINENSLNTTVITETTLLEELTLNENTDYIFILETYEDSEGLEYTERLYYFDEITVNYKYKFMDETGFLIPDNLHIVFPD